MLRAVAYNYAYLLAKGSVSSYATAQSAIAALSTVAGGDPLAFTSCLLLNVSLCPPTQSGSPQVVLLYNSLSRPLVSTVRLPSNSSSVKLFDAAGLPVNDSAVAVLPAQVTEATPVGAAAWDVFVQVEIPPMGFTTLFFYTATSAEQPAQQPEVRGSPGSLGAVAGQRWQLQFDNGTGLLSSVTDSSTGAAYPLQQQFLYYRVHAG